MERGKGVGQEGWGKGVRVRGARGWNLYFNEIFQQNTLNISILNFKGKSTVYSNSLCI